MSNLKATFEKELKTRLAQKAKPNQPEDSLLIKAMKFFDLNNSGTVSKDEFSKALDRLGVNSYKEEQIQQLFTGYDLDNSGELDYKEFTSILFGTPRSPTRQSKATTAPQSMTSQVQAQAQTQKQEQIQPSQPRTEVSKASKEPVVDFDDAELIDILVTLQDTLRKRGTTGILGIARMFRIVDDNNNKKIEFEEFYKVLRDYQIDLSLAQVQKLYSFFDKDGSGTIDYDELLHGIRGKLNPFRKNLVNQVFAKLDKNNNGVIELDDIQKTYDASRHPDVINGKKRESDVLEEFLKTFESYSYYKGKVDSTVTREEFEDYYGFISASIDNDQYFELMLTNAWKLNEPTQTKQRQEESKTNELVVNEYHQLQGNVGFTMKRLKQRLSPRGLKAFIVIHKLLRVIDADNDGLITQREFLKAFKENRLEMADQDALAIVEHYDKQNKGSLPIKEFMQDLLVGLSSSRREVVETAWNSLSGSQTGQIDLGVLKNAFKDQRNHPDVKGGRKTDLQVTDELNEAWDIYRNFVSKTRTDYVTKQEFENFMLYLSAAYEDEDLFTSVILQTFKIRPQSRQTDWAGMTAGGKKNYDPKSGYVQNMHGSFYAGGTTHSNAPFGTSQEAFNPYKEPVKASPKKTNKNEQEEIDQKAKSRAIQQNQSLIFSGPQDKDLFEQLKRKISSRGTRGILGIARLFKNIDDDNSKTISFQEFNKALKDFRISIVDEDAQKIFSFLDLNKNGSIDYEEFLRMITGEMNENRKKIVTEIFQRLDKDGNGFLTIEDIKELYNAKQHPDVKTGKKNEDDVLMEFLETFEQHHNVIVNKPKDRKVTLEEFLEYYNHISCSIDDDRYFELMMNNVWSSSRNYKKGWGSNV